MNNEKQHKFELVSTYKPSGDQPQAINELVTGLKNGAKNQVLLGVTGSGKTFTMANIINAVNKPTLVIAHNKTLAAQLCNEFRELFPNNRVEFFVSYYDYYQPEAYIASSDTYIEKDSSVNEEIEKLRNSATASLLKRNDTIVVASVSCIYGLGNPEEYFKLQIEIVEGDELDRNELIKKLISIQYNRNDVDFKRSSFRVKGDCVDVFPPYSTEIAVKIEFFGDEVEKISEFNALTGEKIAELKSYSFFPATHYAVGSEKLDRAIKEIKSDAEKEVDEFEKQGKLIEAQRLKERVNYDLEMMREIGWCSGIENYSRYFDGRQIGEAPYTLIDYFPKDYLLLIDESHMSIPQIHAMYNGDKARKKNLIDFGFRLNAAFDNRPLKFEEFKEKQGQTIYFSATPAKYELDLAEHVSEQLIRPTGLLDPEIIVEKTDGQIDVLLNEINKTVTNNGRVLITTLTKKMAESLSTFLAEHGVKTRYMHSEIETIERIDIINGLRSGEFDVLVGINLLREGLDMPEVKLVAILDADKEGFLRSAGALIQTIGRAARNSEGRVILFADKITAAMQIAISETKRRRQVQNDFNIKNGIIPKTIIKEIKNTLEITKKSSDKIDDKNIPAEIEKLQNLMKIASSNLNFEEAIICREKIAKLKKRLNYGKR